MRILGAKVPNVSTSASENLRTFALYLLKAAGRGDVPPEGIHERPARAGKLDMPLALDDFPGRDSRSVGAGIGIFIGTQHPTGDINAREQPLRPRVRDQLGAQLRVSGRAGRAAYWTCR